MLMNTRGGPPFEGLYVDKFYTANVYRELQGLYRDIRVQGFQIYRDCMYCILSGLNQVVS